MIGNSTQEQQRRSLRPAGGSIKHPFIWLFVLSVLAFGIWAVNLPEHEYKKLDYSKPIFTGDLAIICPRSLLFDVRQDHGPNAVLEAFTSVLHRSEKVKALGCEEWQGGIPVQGRKLDPPFDLYVAISLRAGQPATLFTMEANLTNSPTGNPDDLVPAQTSAPQSTEGSGNVIQRAYQQEWANFQKVFPSLVTPAPNLRWYPHIDPHLKPGEVMTQLVTPYGPCALLMSVDEGFTVLVGDSPYVTDHAPQPLGQFSSENEAAQASERYCSNWYQQTHEHSHDAVREKQLWFSPDSETTQTNLPEAAPPTDEATPKSGPGSSVPALSESSQ